MKKTLHLIAGFMFMALAGMITSGAAQADVCASPAAPASCGVVWKVHTYTTCVPQEREVCVDKVIEVPTCERKELHYPIDACPGGGCGCGGDGCGNVRQYIPYSICVPGTKEETIRECHTETVCVPEQRCVRLPHCEGGDCGAMCGAGGCAPQPCSGAGFGTRRPSASMGVARRAMSGLPAVPANIPNWLRPVRR